MDLSTVVAKVFGIYLIVSGLFLLMRGKTLPLLVKDFFEHRAVVFLAGAILVFFGGVLVMRHNLWDGSWRTWVTVLGWLALIKGVMYILFMEVLAKINVQRLRPWLGLLGVAAIALGVILFRIA